MKNISLKYRIALVIFLLEALLMYFVLGPILSSALKETKKQLAMTENVMLGLLSDLGRIALFTSEYDELQPYIESVVMDPHVEKIYLTNNNNLVVVSSDVSKVGQDLPSLTSSQKQFWKTKEIVNSAGKLGLLAIEFSHSELAQIIERTRHKGITIAVSGMLVIALIGIIMGFILTRRLVQLSDASANITQGNFDTGIDLSGQDEIALLSRSFDQMRRKIKNNIAELNRHKNELEAAKANLEQHVEERTVELAKARDEALEANKLKSSFITNMSHELRTPLNIILGYADLLESDLIDQGHPEFTKDIGKIKSSGKHLLEIVNSVLDLSSIEVGELTLQMEEENINAYLGDLVQHISPWFEKRKNKFLYENYITNDKVCTDVLKLKKILFNVLDNANKFTDQGEVTLKTRNTQVNSHSYILFEITDTGVGMDQLQVNRIFAEFYQVDASSSRHYEGTGLGLTLSKKYCEMLGGKIDVESEPGKGSKVSIYIPMISPVE